MCMTAVSPLINTNYGPSFLQKKRRIKILQPRVVFVAISIQHLYFECYVLKHGNFQDCFLH